MKSLIIAGFAVVALLGIASGLLGSRSPTINGQTTGMATSSPRQPQAVRSADLPVQDFDDRSLVFPREPKP
jgi:hypothetical protein